MVGNMICGAARAMLIAAILSSTSISTASFAEVSPSRTDSLPVGRCVNMGNHLEAPSEGAWGGRKIADDDFALIAKAGFDTVRLPVRWSTHAGNKTPYAIDPHFMKRVKHLVQLAHTAGLNVILNSHHFEEIHSDPARNAPKLAGMWRQIAVEFQSFSKTKLWFEIENEPHDKLNNENLLQTLSPALAAIRETNPDRPVIIGGENWSGIDSLLTLKLPDDPHVVPTFHYYDPFAFTHQGASWVDPSPPVGRIWPVEGDMENLYASVEKVRNYVARTGKTPFMGETGAHTTISLDQRAAYIKAVRKAFDKTKIGICVWAFTNTMPVYNSDNKQWLAPMLDAIGVEPR